VKRRIDITIERQKLLLVRRRITVTSRCAGCGAAGCGAQTAFVTPESAAADASVSTRQIYRWIEAGSVHALERPDHQLLVCTASLERAVASVRGSPDARLLHPPKEDEPS
jgi:hypothetical protein